MWLATRNAALKLPRTDTRTDGWTDGQNLCDNKG